MHHPSDHPDELANTWISYVASGTIMAFALCWIAAVSLKNLAYSGGRLLRRAVPDLRTFAHAGFRAALGLSFIGVAHVFESPSFAFIGKTGLVLAVYGLVGHAEGTVANAVLDRLGIRRDTR